MKRLKYEIPKEVMRQAKEQLVTLNVARTELIARLDELPNKVPNLSQQAESYIKSARNSLQDHLTQDDLVGALRDKFNQPVRVSGSGKTFDHADEVEKGVESLNKARRVIVEQMSYFQKGSNEYKLLSREADALAEMSRRIGRFLDTE